jgi:DNA polymerase
MDHFHIDFETFSEIDLTEVGAYRYAEHPSTDPLCLAYARGNVEPRAWAPSAQGRTCPPRIVRAIDEGAYFCAHNALFERAIWRYVMVPRYGWPDVPSNRWRCTACMAAAVGFPRSLDGATRRAKLPEHLLKDKRGGALLKIFSMPRKPTKMDARTRIRPEDAPDDFEQLVEYCKQDVRAERGLFDYLPDLPEREWIVWLADLKINEEGMPLDRELLQQAIRALLRIERTNQKRCVRITGFNPTQRDRMLDWLDESGCTLPNLQLETVQSTLANKHIHITPQVRTVLGLRIEASRASTKKISKMLECMMDDDRARGMYLYAGAHTLRWSSRILQLHNFIRGYDDPARIQTILDAYRTGDATFVRALYKNPIWELSKCIRGFIAAPTGQELGVIDYSQIEARNLDWHADNEIGLEMWADGTVDPYIVMATHIYGCSYDEVKAQKSGEMRRIGKNTTLGCGFQMSAGAWLAYARKMGSKADEDLAELAVGTYREINKAVVDYWYDVQNHAIAAIAEPSRTVKLRKIAFEMVDHWLTIILPSGRRIWYPYARITTGKTKFGKTVEQIVFMGANHQEHTYGGKVVENVVQATSRDIMAGGLVNSMRAGHCVVGHTHDEGIFLGRKIDIPTLVKDMCVIPPWAKGMPLVAKGFTTPFYWKG